MHNILRKIFNESIKENLFDPVWYQSYYKRSFSSDFDAFIDCLNKSKFSDVSPSTKFDSLLYYINYPDVYENGVFSAIEHYLMHGKQEGKNIFPLRTRWIPKSILKTENTINKSRRYRIAIVLHIYYTDFVDKYAESLLGLNFDFDLFITTSSSEVYDKARLIFLNNSNLGKIEIKLAPNQGRNFGPFLVEFSKQLLHYDYFLHLHSKKSLYTGREMTHWSNYLIEYLLRDKSILSSALDIMESNQNYGLYYPVTYWAMPEWVNHLLKNKHSCLDYLMRNGMTQDVDDFIPYPVGSMFIAKSSALEPLLKKNWEYDDFPSEPIPADGTFLHALERLLPFIVKSTGHQEFYYNPGTGDFTEDSSWIFSKYNNYNEHTLNHLLSLNDIISFDIFDTLAKREYAEPDYAKYLLPFRLGLNISGFDFVRVRNDVEYKLRVEAEFKGDVNIYEIYIRLVSELGLTHDPLELADLEFEIDLEMLSAKDIIIKILIDQNKVGKKIYIISDTYYMEHHIRKLLYRIGLRCKYELFVSSSLRIRKDDGTMWEMIEQYLRSQKKKDKFIHIGDNVCSDGQIPGDYGLRSFHILNPMDKWQACGFPRIKNVLSIDNPDSIHKWGQLVCQVGDDPFL